MDSRFLNSLLIAIGIVISLKWLLVPWLHTCLQRLGKIRREKEAILAACTDEEIIERLERPGTNLIEKIAAMNVASQRLENPGIRCTLDLLKSSRNRVIRAKANEILPY